MKQNKVLGALYGAAYGDSLGAVTEFRSREDIREAFPEGVQSYVSSISYITSGITPGCVTDDFGSSLYFMKEIIAKNGTMNRNVAVNAVLKWSEDPVVFAKYAGQNSKAAIQRIKEGNVIDEKSRQMHFLGGNTNGAAMRAAPMGILAAGDFDRAIQYALDLAWPTHYNSAAASAAASIACAVTEALQDGTSIEKITEAGIAGAEKARLQLEKEGYASFGPFVDKKIQKAADIASEAADQEELMDRLEDTIGTGISVQESIPAVFAVINAFRGDFQKAIRCTVNAGGDTDTISSMTGAILGAFDGIQAIDPAAMLTINQVNEFLDLKNTIQSYTELVCSKGE